MKLVERATQLGDRAAGFVLERGTIDIVRLMTLLLLLMHGPKDWYARNPLIVLAMAGVFFPKVRTMAAFWFGCAMFILAHDIVSWAEVDNHKWLMGWWCLALGLVAMTPEAHRLRVLKTNARVILGLVFAFATLWKVVSFDYVDSTFFKWELLTDKRFRAVAHYVGGVDRDDLRKNRDIRKRLQRSFRSDATPEESKELKTGPYVDPLAIFMTWWTILLEGSIAVFCLWPGDRLVAILRTGVVLVFAATTYLLAPVLGFGWVVITMGFAQCPERYRKLRAAFFVTIALLYLYRLKIGPAIAKTAEHGLQEMTRFF